MNMFDIMMPLTTMNDLIIKSQSYSIHFLFRILHCNCSELKCMHRFWLNQQERFTQFINIKTIRVVGVMEKFHCLLSCGGGFSIRIDFNANKWNWVDSSELDRVQKFKRDSKMWYLTIGEIKLSFQSYLRWVNRKSMKDSVICRHK